MRHKFYPSPATEHVELIATFGEASVVKHLDGKFELRGGSIEDQVEAYAWVEIACPPDRRPVRPAAPLQNEYL